MTYETGHGCKGERPGSTPTTFTITIGASSTERRPCRRPKRDTSSSGRGRAESRAGRGHRTESQLTRELLPERLGTDAHDGEVGTGKHTQRGEDRELSGFRPGADPPAQRGAA